MMVSSLNIASALSAWTGTLDLGDNDLIVHNGTPEIIRSLLLSGLNTNGGYWNGKGLVTSSAATDPIFRTTLGWAANNDGHGNPLFGNTGPFGLFDGQSPALNDVLVKYTYYGDADLDGKVDGTDYSLVDGGFNNRKTGWINGDFNYDNVVDGTDYSLIDGGFNNQGAALASGEIQTVGVSASEISNRSQTAATAAILPGQSEVVGQELAPSSGFHFAEADRSRAAATIQIPNSSWLGSVSMGIKEGGDWISPAWSFENWRKHENDWNSDPFWR